MWPGFDYRTKRYICMWVEFVVGSGPCSERFFSVFPGFPLSSKTNIFKFQFDLESVISALRLLHNKVIYFIYLTILVHFFPNHLTYAN